MTPQPNRQAALDSRRKLGENDPGLYEISILIGPCSLAEAEAVMWAVDAKAVSFALGACTAISTWDEDADA